MNLARRIAPIAVRLLPYARRGLEEGRAGLTDKSRRPQRSPRGGSHGGNLGVDHTRPHQCGNHDAVPMRNMRPPTAATVTSSDDAHVPVRWSPFPIGFYTLQQFVN
jgi:hypothetical protein